MPPNDSLIFRAFCSQTENRACRCISFLPMLPIFLDRKAGKASRTVLQITGSHFLLAYYSSWNMRLPVLTLSQSRGFLCCKISFYSQKFSQQKMCLKAQKLHLAEQQLPHNSLQPLLNIRQKLSQLDCWQLTFSV